MLLFRFVLIPRSFNRPSAYYYCQTGSILERLTENTHGKVVVYCIRVLPALSQISLPRPSVPQSNFFLHLLQTRHFNFSQQERCAPKRLRFGHEWCEGRVNFTGEKDRSVVSCCHFGRHQTAVEPPGLPGWGSLLYLFGHGLGNRIQVGKKLINLDGGLGIFLSPLVLKSYFTWKPEFRSLTGTECRKMVGPSSSHQDIIGVDDGTVAKLDRIVDKRLDGRAVDGDISLVDSLPVVRNTGNAKTRVRPMEPAVRLAFTIRVTIVGDDVRISMRNRP